MLDDLDVDRWLAAPNLGQTLADPARGDELGLIHPQGHGLLLEGDGSVRLATDGGLIQLDPAGEVTLEGTDLWLNGRSWQEWQEWQDRLDETLKQLVKRLDRLERHLELYGLGRPGSGAEPTEPVADTDQALDGQLDLGPWAELDPLEGLWQELNSFSQD